MVFGSHTFGWTSKCNSPDLMCVTCMLVRILEKCTVFLAWLYEWMHLAYSDCFSASASYLGNTSSHWNVMALCIENPTKFTNLGRIRIYICVECEEACSAGFYTLYSMYIYVRNSVWFSVKPHVSLHVFVWILRARKFECDEC